jgi:hypothetical protein
LITGMELDELQRFDWMVAEAFGLDRRIANYQGGVCPDKSSSASW